MTGNNTETMTRQEWDVSDLQGQIAQLVVDNSSGGQIIFIQKSKPDNYL